MPRRTPLPPSPPPPEIRNWPDRETLLADRALALDELGRRLLGGKRLTLFLVALVLVELGWALVGVLLTAFDQAALDPITLLPAVVAACLGIGALVPGVWLTVRGVLADRVVRGRLGEWATLDRHAAADARLRAPGWSVCWLLVGFLLCAVGLWISFAVPAGTTRENGGYGLVAYGMGAGLALWVHGLVGLAKAAGHYRFAVRLTGRPGDRSASSGRPRPE
ncbi:hypothetical protein EAO71_29275 [Streptomyces sp. ms191]|uniref:hypothetical protein n=1 Tax=Streptomyces sp. ms191 TaxID=1827978 RepID=UPI0011CE6E32|nr:hypothetical protein [Streptomyces sp. ms191]TXS20626.1 hypothetical protein EAO71_29275 [Streptomyces sp. ms191]